MNPLTIIITTLWVALFVALVYTKIKDKKPPAKGEGGAY